MHTESRPATPPADRQINPRHCPCCRAVLVRERRRLVDRLHSLFQPIKRYRCQNFACQWVGNFASPKADQDTDRPPDRVPTAFVVHMALVAVGVVVVIVLSNLEPSGWADDGEPQRSSFNDDDATSERIVKQASRR